jgi:hypothetical protein
MIRRLQPQFRLAHGISKLLETPLMCGISIAAAKLVPSLVSFAGDRAHDKGPRANEQIADRRAAIIKAAWRMQHLQVRHQLQSQAAPSIELARHGVQVIVLESSRGPRHVVCGEFLSEEAQSLLRQLGVDPHARGATSIERFRLVKGERHAITQLPFEAAALSRRRLDELLLQAAGRAGAEVIRGIRVTRIEPSAGTVIVQDAKRTWHAAAVALATGKHSMRGFSLPPSPTVGFKMRLQPTSAVCDLARTVQLAFFRSGYVGACVVEDGVLSMAWVMLTRSLLRWSVARTEPGSRAGSCERELRPRSW